MNLLPGSPESYECSSFYFIVTHKQINTVKLCYDGFFFKYDNNYQITLESELPLQAEGERMPEKSLMG